MEPGRCAIMSRRGENAGVGQTSSHSEGLCDRFTRTSCAAALDHPLGKGHVVMFAIRPFWRWQTQGTR